MSIFHFNSIKVRLEQAFWFYRDAVAFLFQFHKGTIRTFKSVCFIKMFSDFNSIKVRLERVSERTKRPLAWFQFHKGTIRTWSGYSLIMCRSIFQFHKGTIRTWWHVSKRFYRNYFNSIKVRLEPFKRFRKVLTSLISIP